MINMAVDTAKITKLQAKFAKYGPYAIKQGLKAQSAFLNDPNFKSTMYPPESNAPFVWSSIAQQRKVMALLREQGGPPYRRTMNLANSGQFNVNEESFWIEYTNTADYAKFVVSSSSQIIGMRKRGWKPVNQFIVAISGKLVPIFKQAALAAWAEMDAFISGGGAGL